MVWIVAYNYPLSIYLIKQAEGQLTVLINKQSFQSYQSQHTLGPQEHHNILLIEDIKRFSIDSLGYKSTQNFTSVYDQNNKPILWVVTASNKYELVPFEWDFPIIGRVSYKGFFKEELAQKERTKLISMGYDAGIRSVSAWSTLGWFDDPLLSSHLKKKTGDFCNLLFHELFHATFYKPNQINNNENLANFIAHKATLAFLKNDTITRNAYLKSYNEHEKLILFLKNKTESYKRYLKTIYSLKNRSILKQQHLIFLLKDLKKLGIKKKRVISNVEREILTEQNAYFIDYMQYNSKQDSLENAFNKFYTRSIKNMVQSLTQ